MPNVSQGEEEFPGLAFGIRGLDQQQKFSSTQSHQDFPSLGGPAGGEGGSKPAGAWGKGPGQLAGGTTSHCVVATCALMHLTSHEHCDALCLKHVCCQLACGLLSGRGKMISNDCCQSSE